MTAIANDVLRISESEAARLLTGLPLPPHTPRIPQRISAVMCSMCTSNPSTGGAGWLAN